MTIKNRFCIGSEDFPAISDFLYKLYQPNNRDGCWLQPIWEYAYTHPSFDEGSVSRIGIWEDLLPVALGAVGLVLVFPRRVPLMLALLVGLAGGVLGVFTYLEVGVPPQTAGLETMLRFGLILGGGVLLLLAGFVTLTRPASRSLAK